MIRSISNVRFEQAVSFMGEMKKNYQAGDKHAELTLDERGLMIDIPDQARITAYSVFVPFHNIKQIDYKV